jgi:hypothetical protein
MMAWGSLGMAAVAVLAAAMAAGCFTATPGQDSFAPSSAKPPQDPWIGNETRFVAARIVAENETLRLLGPRVQTFPSGSYSFDDANGSIRAEGLPRNYRLAVETVNPNGSRSLHVSDATRVAIELGPIQYWFTVVAAPTSLSLDSFPPSGLPPNPPCSATVKSGGRTFASEPPASLFTTRTPPGAEDSVHVFPGDGEGAAACPDFTLRIRNIGLFSRSG